MADQVINKQELIDAQKDVKNAGEAVNTKKVIIPRYGAPFKSLPLVVEELNTKANEVIAQGFYTGYPTETALKASLPTVSEMRARADDTRKIWRWNRTSAEGVIPVTGTWIDTGPSDMDAAVAQFIEEAQRQGVALDQLDDYYQHLLQGMADIAADKGWLASLVVDTSGKNQQQINNEQKQINDGVKTIADLLAIQDRQNGMRINVKGYHAPTLFVEANPYKGGGTFVWDAANTATANGGTIIAVDGVAVGRWIRLLENYSVVTPQMFGAKADNVNDDYTAIMAAVNSFRFEDERVTRIVGPTVFFPAGRYYSSQTINLKTVCRLVGENNNHAVIDASTIEFASGTDGIIINAIDTLGPTGTTGQTTSAEGSTIKGLHITQRGYVRRSMPAKDYNPTIGRFIGPVSALFLPSTEVKGVNNWLEAIFTGTVGQGFRVDVSLGASEPINGTAIGDVFTGQTSGATGEVAYIGYKTLAYSLINTTGTFVVGETVTSSKGSFVVTVANKFASYVFPVSNITGDLPQNTVVMPSTDYGIGLNLRTRATIKNVKITAFPTYGLAMISSGVYAPTNMNLVNATGLMVSDIGKDGIIALGGDSNAATFIQTNATNCSGYGVNDTSFLGNYFFGSHTSTCMAGAYLGTGFSVFAGCYSEAGYVVDPYYATTSRFAKETTVIGGDHGAGIQPLGDSRGTRIGGSNFYISDGIYSTQTSTSGQLAKPLTLRGGNSGTNEVLALAKQTNVGIGRGIDIAFYQGNNGRGVKYDNSDLFYAGKIGCEASPYINRAFFDFTARKELPSVYGFSFSYTPSSTIGGQSAVLEPVVENGQIKELVIKYGGAMYDIPPTITGTGLFAGLTATTKVFNGSIVKVEITNNLTGFPDLAPTQCFYISHPLVRAGIDNTTSLGSASVRFKDIYAATGTINTSDEREKQQVRELSEAEKRVAIKLKSQIRAFKFNDSVNEKSDNARIHFGVIAQEVKAAFESDGLVAEDYAVLCYDEWEDEYREITEEITVTNDAGEEVTETIETGERELIRAAGNRYGVRYEELLAFIISVL